MSASADERDRPVGDEQLVVHAVVEPAVAEGELDHAQQQVVSAITKRIENADGDIRLRGKREQLLIAGDTLGVIDQVRTRTPRAAALLSASVIRRPDSSPWKM